MGGDNKLEFLEGLKVLGVWRGKFEQWANYYYRGSSFFIGRRIGALRIYEVLIGQRMGRMGRVGRMGRS